MRGHTNCLLACIAIVAGLVFAPPTRPQIKAPDQHDYDIVIRGGRAFDGAGNPRIFADVTIKDACASVHDELSIMLGTQTSGRPDCLGPPAMSLCEVRLVPTERGLETPTRPDSAVD